MTPDDLPPCPKTCRGHRRFIGGFLDGHVDHMALVTPSDFPFIFRYPNGAEYERDLDGGTEATYRLMAVTSHHA